MVVQQDTVVLSEKAIQLYMSEKAVKAFDFIMQASTQLDAAIQHHTHRCLKHGDYVRTDF